MAHAPASVDARAAEQLPFDNRHFHASRGQALGEKGPGLAGSDDDRVVGCGHGLLRGII
jgi:hypothetical protein